MLFFSVRILVVIFITLLLCAVSKPVLPRSDSNVSDVVAVRPASSDVSDPELNISSQATGVGRRRVQIQDINAAQPAPRCYVRHKGLFLEAIIANLWTDAWYNQKKHMGQVSNQEALRLLREEIGGCGAPTKWKEGKGINGRVNMVQFRLPETAKGGCVGRAFRSASSLPAINCAKKHDFWGIFNVVTLALGVAAIAGTLGATLVPAISSAATGGGAAVGGGGTAAGGSGAVSAGTASLDALSAGAVAGGEVLPVEVGVAEVPVAQAGVGVLDEGLAQTLSQTGRTVATELSPIYPHASIPESLQSMPKLVLSNSPESMSSLSRASLTTFTSKDSLAPIAGELTDSTGKIFSRTAGEVTDHALSKFGLKTRGWQDIADAANELFGHVPIAGWKMNPPIEGWYPPVAPAVKRSNASEQVATQNATKGATTKYTSKIGVQIYKSNIKGAPKDMEWAAMIHGHFVLGKKEELERYINSLYYCMFGC